MSGRPYAVCYSIRGDARRIISFRKANEREKRMRRPLSNKDGEVRLFRPIAEHDPGMVEAMKDFPRKVGRPKAVAPKVHVGFRLSADIVASIKASGRGYNARVEQALREAGFGGGNTPRRPRKNEGEVSELEERALGTPMARGKP